MKIEFSFARYFFKRLHLIITLALLLVPPLARADQIQITNAVVSTYAVTQRGPNSRTWTRVTATTNSSGRVLYRTNSYNELATGLHYWNGDQWTDASDQIQLTPNGAAATNTQHQVTFAPNINTVGAINLTTPDNLQMASHVLGLAYADSDSHSNVLFAETQDSLGQLLLAGNQVIYTNAFANADADILYSQKLSGLEQDIVLREQLPSPASCGLTGSNIWLQVWTEFTTAPDPQISQSQTNGDSLLDFGVMKMGRGKAFLLGNSSSSVPVIKAWVTSQGRTFLVESVFLNNIAAAMTALPAASGSSGSSNSVPGTNSGGNGEQANIRRPHTAYASLTPPHPNSIPTRGAHPPPGAIRHALVSNIDSKSNSPATMRPARSPAAVASSLWLDKNSAQKGLVLDYNLVNCSQTNAVFQSDTTYYITNAVNLYGTCVLEGGTVIKYSTNADAAIVVTKSTNLVCNTAPYRPAIFTAQDDDTIGDQLSVSTGVPVGYYGFAGIQIPNSSENTPPVWSHLRFSWLQQGIYLENSLNVRIYDAQFVNCGVGIYLDTIYLHLRNALFSNVATNFYCVPEPAELFLENVTVDGGNRLCDIEGFESYPWDDPSIGDPPSFRMYVTNCILIGTTNLGVGLTISGDPNVSVTDTSILTNDSNVFETVGGGAFYLPSGSTNRGAGTTNIDPILLADLSQLTTWAPVVYAATNLSNNLDLVPVIARYTNGNPDRGYYYAAIDYAFGDVLLTNATLAVSNGTVIAAFDTNSSGYSLNIVTDGQFITQGTPNNLNRIINFNLVQENSNANWSTPAGAFINPGSSLPIACRFTDFGIPCQDTSYLITYTGFSTPPGFQDCQFHGGIMFAVPAPIDFTNCLLERVYTQMFGDSSTPLTLRNNLFYGGSLAIGDFPISSVVQDNMFDQTAISDDGSYTGGWNGYVTNCYQLSVSYASDVVLSNSVYQTNWLRNYYIPASSLLANKGSTNANFLGLYEYTTHTNQVKQSNSVVDIGYHYVSTDTNGNPASTLWLGLPDYLLDTNGDGDTNLVNWELKYFGYTGLNPSGDYDCTGTNNLQKYLTGVDPNVITFSLSVADPYVTNSSVAAVVNVVCGVPSSLAVLVDSTNFSGATWSSYTSSNLSINIGSIKGPHNIWVGLRGLPSDATQTWQETTVVLNGGIVLAWGDNDQGQCDVPLSLSNVVQVTGGLEFTLALQADGSVTAWGDDTHGETNFPSGLSNVVAVACGAYHTLALLADGTVTNWGAWWPSGSIYAPLTMPSNLTNVVSIAAGVDHDLALMADGTVVAWGYTNDPYNVVPSGLPGATAVAAGSAHSVALLTNGTVIAWGFDDSGLGLNLNLTNVPSGLSNVVAIAAGYYHTLALNSDGTVTAWGAGNGSNFFFSYGQSIVPSGLSNVVAIAAGGYHSMALKNDGTVVVWGDLTLPSYNSGFQSNVFAIGAGGDHELVICSGSLPPIISGQPVSQFQPAGSTTTFAVAAFASSAITYQWQFDGTNIAGATNSTLTLTNVQSAQTGNYQVVVEDASGSSVSSNAAFALLEPPQILSFSPPANSTNWIASPIYLSVTATDNDLVDFPLSNQWLLNGTNIPGSVNSNIYIVPGYGPGYGEGSYTLEVTNPAGTTNVGPWQIYAFLPGMVAGWGDDATGQIDRPATLTNVIGLTAGALHAAAVQDNGIVVAWGDNTLTQTSVPSGLSNVVVVAAGAYHTLALKANGTVVAWGDDTMGQINVPSGLTNIIAIAAGGDQSMALSNNGTVATWGDNIAALPSNLSNIMAIAAGGSSFLALSNNGTVTAWGAGGDPVVTNLPTGLSNVVAIAAGASHALALQINGTVTAWGDNTYGQTNVPIGLSNVMAVAAGAAHSVALLNNGTVIAWGDDSHGQTNMPSLPSTPKLIAAGDYFTLIAAFSPIVQYYPLDVSKDLLLIYNTNSLDSSNVMSYYLANRPMVSNANVLGIGYTNYALAPINTNCGVSNTFYTNYYETISPGDFTNLMLAPIQSWLTTNPTKRPQYVVLFLDVPIRVNTNTYFPTCGSYPNIGTYPSVQYQLNTACAAGWSPFVTSINMNGTNDCEAYINKIASMASNGPPGELIISASSASYENTNYYFDDTEGGYSGNPLAMAAEQALIQDGISSNSIFYTNVYPDCGSLSCHITNGNNVAGYISWGGHSSLRNDFAINGDVTWTGDSTWYIMETIESFNGRRLPDPTQSNFLEWFSNNAFGGADYSNTPVGALSNVDEPGLPGSSYCSTFFGLWAVKKNFAICAWNAVNTPYFQAIGDPFVRK